MLLRVSSQSQGEEVELFAVTDSDAKSGVPHGEVLTAFAEASVRGEAEHVVSARDALERAMGQAAVVDAAGVVGNFQRMVRIADGTGIPLDKPVAVFSGGLRDELGLEAFGSSGNTPPVNPFLRFVGRVTQPLIRIVMSRYATSR